MKKAPVGKRTRAKRKDKVKKTWKAAWWFLLVVIVLMIGCVGVTFWASKEFEPHNVAEKKFDEIAREYYEEYLYPKFVERNSENLETEFERYAQNGFGAVRLRQMLSRLESANVEDDTRSYFVNSAVECDTDNSSVIYLPVAPYGKKDYTTKYNLVCQ